MRISVPEAEIEYFQNLYSDDVDLAGKFDEMVSYIQYLERLITKMEESLPCSIEEIESKLELEEYL